MTTVTYSIPNISCNHCVHTITMELKDMAGVSGVDADMAGVWKAPPSDRIAMMT